MGVIEQEVMVVKLVRLRLVGMVTFSVDSLTEPDKILEDLFLEMGGGGISFGME